MTEPKRTEDQKGLSLLDLYKQDVDRDVSIVDEQRDKANEDMRFVNVSGGMWEDFLETEFSDRTKLEFDIISNYINRFIGQWNQNRVGVEFKPDDSRTSDEDAELLNGIYRADFRQFSGKMSVDNAVDEQATCGYGAFKLGTRFVDEDDPENDFQRTEWRPIYNAYNTIFWDRSAKRIDKRDAKYCTELIPFTQDSFEIEFPGKNPVSAYDPNTRRGLNVNRSNPKLIYVGKRYQIIKKKETVFVYNNLIDNKVEIYSEEDHELVKQELEANEFKSFVRKRVIMKQTVETTLFSGDEILEEAKRIPGKYIPIIPIYGYHAYIDGVEWYRGLVRKLMDASRLFNMQVSQLAENAASAGQEIPIFDPDQMKGGVGDLWADRNSKPYLLARALRNEDGSVVHHGPTAYLKPQQLDGNVQALLQIVPNFVQDVTGGAPQDTINPDMSGKAINALMKREDLNTQVLNDNIANAVEWSGVVWESIATDGIYTEERMVTLIGKDGTESQKQLLRAVLDEDSGKLIRANDLTGKKFRVYADVGPQYNTLREQTVEDLKGMLDSIKEIPGAQQYLAPMLAVMMDNITGVNLDTLKDFNRRIMIMQGLAKPETDEEKQMLADMQAQQNNPDGQALLLAAAAEQASAEARERESKVVDNMASAAKKQAETNQIISETRTNEAKTLVEIRQQIFDSATTGTLQ